MSSDQTPGGRGVGRAGAGRGGAGRGALIQFFKDVGSDSSGSKEQQPSSPTTSRGQTTDSGICTQSPVILTGRRGIGRGIDLISNSSSSTSNQTQVNSQNIHFKGKKFQF